MAMKKLRPLTLRFRLDVIVGGLFCAAGSLVAQEALRTAVQGDRSYETRNAPDYQPRDERMRIGPVSFDIGVSYGLEWNDNINLTSGNQESDVIHRPGVNLRAVWPATKESTLSFGTGIGYVKYMDNSDLDQFTIAPDSELAWDISVEDFIFTLYDNVQYSQDVVSQGGLSGTAQFPRLENTVGVRMLWHPSRYDVEAGYAHYNFFADSDTFDYLTRSSEQFFGRVAYHFGAITRAGIEASGALTDYDSATRDDNQNLSIGPFVDWQLMRDLRITLRGGLVTYFFDDGATTNRTSDLNSYYFGASVKHALTDHITHSLSVDRSVQQGINQGGDVAESLSLSYHVAWAFHRRASLSVSPFYEHATEPQLGVEEEYDHYGINLGLSYRFTNRLTSSLGYRYTERETNFIGRDYQQNSVILSASYQF